MARRPLRCPVLLVVLLTGFANAAGAQTSDSVLTFEPDYITTALTPAASAPVPDALAVRQTNPWAAPALQTTLLASFAVLQGLDAGTTLSGIDSGRASEANPFMGGLAQHPAALVGVKAGLTAATVISMRSWSKSHPRAAALTLFALNAGSAFVVRSNFRLLRAQ
jgi:hypothetical protein